MKKETKKTLISIGCDLTSIVIGIVVAAGFGAIKKVTYNEIDKASESKKVTKGFWKK